MIRPAPRAVVFDLDGTLVDSVQDLAAAMNATLRELGHPPHPTACYRQLIGAGANALVARALPPAHRRPAHAEAARALMRVHYRRHALRTTRPYPGVRWLLAELNRRRVPMAVLSNKLHQETVQVVRGLFPGVPFRAVRGLGPHSAPKPDPAGLLALARTLRLHPRQLLLIGDGDADMLAGRRCGAYPVGATWGYRPPRELLAAGAAELITHPRSVTRYLRQQPTPAR